MPSGIANDLPWLFPIGSSIIFQCWSDIDFTNFYVYLKAQPLPPAYEVTEKNLENAKKVVAKLNAFGGTDIQSALKVGLELVEKNLVTDKKHQPLIVFLTDGEATVGEVDNEKIISTVSPLNRF